VSNREKMSRSTSVKVNSPEVWAGKVMVAIVDANGGFKTILRSTDALVVASRKCIKISHGAWSNFPFAIAIVHGDRFFFLKLNDEVSFHHLIQLTATQSITHLSILTNLLSLSRLSPASLRTQDDRVVYMSPVL